MFIDEANLILASGSGGDGAVSFRREKYIPQGGPDGGDGGAGGNVYIESTNSLNTLLHFRHIKILKAKNGENGSGCLMTGKDGEDVVIKVPVGTVIKANDMVIYDFNKERRVLFLKGGTGGKGNAKFKSSRTQAPYLALKGKKGLEIEVKLELKLLADVALVGLPNAGKSSFINAVTSAKSKVGDYPFTTLNPKLGVVSRHDKTFVIADIPGLIEGASQGKGLGHQFLKHIERSKLILHLVDLTENNLIENFKIINNELKKYNENLYSREQIVVGTKIDLPFEADEFKNYVKGKYKYFEVSSFTKEGFNSLIDYIFEQLPLQKDQEELEEVEVSSIFESRREPDIVIRKENNTFIVEGRIVHSVLDKYVFTENTIDLLLDILRKEGLDKKLMDAGAKTGSDVTILNQKMEFIE